MGKKRVFFERYIFNSRDQREDEDFENFYKEVKLLANSCEFGNLNDSLIRDRIIAGVNDARLRDKLLSKDVEPDLMEVVSICRSYELAKKQVTVIEATKTVSIDKVSQVNRSKQSKQQYSNQPKPVVNKQEQGPTCTKCGLRIHKNPNDCPATESLCFGCGKKGHYGRCCPKRRIMTVEEDDNGEDSVYYSDSVTASCDHCPSTNKLGKNSAIFVQVAVGNRTIPMKCDTGADFSIMPLQLYNSLNYKQKLADCEVKLKSYCGNSLSVKGSVKMNAKIDGKSYKLKFIVIQAQTRAVPLLGVEACKMIGIVNTKFIDSISSYKSTEDIVQKNLDVFKGLGMYQEEATLVLKPDAMPVAKPPRRVPLALQERLKKALDELVKQEILVEQANGAEWVSNLVVVEKSNGSLRLCMDPKYLNQALADDPYPIPTIQQLRANLAGKKFFSVLDLKDGFYQMKLDESSSQLCCMSTPFGIYRFKRMPNGIKVAPAAFQRRNEKIFGGINNSTVFFDDILVVGSTEKEHDEAFEKVLEAGRTNGIRFNPTKIQYKQRSVRYLGFELSEDGVKIDEDRFQALMKLRSPQNKDELRKSMGFINYVRDFIPNLADTAACLNELTHKNVSFVWLPMHERASKSIKNKIREAATLVNFDETKPLVIQTDASKKGLGCALLQDNQPLCFGSRTLLQHEQRYGQIDKEFLAILYSTIKYHYFMYGRRVIIQTDHKPLVALMNKDISAIPSERLKRIRMKLAKYDLELQYVPGKLLYTADLLSRLNDERLDSDVELDVEGVIHNVNVAPGRTQQLMEATKSDPLLSALKNQVETGWPAKKEMVEQALLPYWSMKDDIYVENGLIFLGPKIIVPSNCRKDILNWLHISHLGINKSLSRARTLFFWIGMTKDVTEKIKLCETCQKFSNNNQKEPLISHTLPKYPFQILFSDIATVKFKDYLVAVDSYSGWLEILSLKNKSAGEVIVALKPVFATHGYPDEFISDAVPFDSQEFRNFCYSHGIKPVTTSPEYAQARAFAEKGVQIAKQIIKKCSETKADLSEALQEYRNTPLTGFNVAPSQLLMSRLVKTNIPMNDLLRKPKIEEDVTSKLQLIRQKSALYYNKTAKERPEFSPEAFVYFKKKMQSEWEKGEVVRKANAPRSYFVKNQEGVVYRRNKWFIKNRPTPPENQTQTPSTSNENQVSIESTRCLRPRENLKPPDWYKAYAIGSVKGK